MLSKEELLKLLQEDPDEAALPKDAITVRLIMNTVPCGRTKAKYKIETMVRDGRIVRAGTYVRRGLPGGNKLPYYLPTKQKK